jgi:hypothetical protein
LTHKIVPDGQGNGEGLANLTYSVLDETDSIQTIDAVIMDNTPTNTGYNNGLCACLEKKLGRKLHLVGCLLHTNELPLRHLITKLDGKTLSGNRFSGPIGQQLMLDTYTSDPVDFQPVSTTVVRPPDDVVRDLSNDQRLLLEYLLGVSSGAVDESYIKRKPGPVSHARWLTTATRILILYTRTEEPSDVLKILVQYIQRVYGTVWFRVKAAKSFIQGPEILFGIIQDVKAVNQNKVISDIVFPVLERNAFCCLPENFLASLLYSADPDHREFAVAKILQIRSEPVTGVASQHVPKINLDAEDWSKLVDISSSTCSQPPCVRQFTNDELEAMKVFPGLPPPIPLHTQSVERAVKLTSEACRTSYTWEKRHEYIVAKIASRQKRKRFSSKKDYA